MCGMFGYSGDRPPDPALLHRIAGAAARRGPHSWGFAVVRHGSPARYVYPSAYPGTLPAAALGHTAIIGHFRLATTGDYHAITQAQPLADARHAIVHNGVIPHPETYAGVDRLETGSDSEAVLVLLRQGYTLTEIRDRLALVHPTIRQAMLALGRDGTVQAATAGHPLWVLETETGRYYGSVPLDGMTRIGDE